MVSGNKDKSRVELTSTGSSVRDQVLIKIYAVLLASSSGLGIFSGLAPTVIFFLHTFHLIQGKITNSSSLYSITVPVLGAQSHVSKMLRYWNKILFVVFAWSIFDCLFSPAESTTN